MYKYVCEREKDESRLEAFESGRRCEEIEEVE